MASVQGENVGFRPRVTMDLLRNNPLLQGRTQMIMFLKSLLSGPRIQPANAVDIKFSDPISHNYVIPQ